MKLRWSILLLTSACLIAAAGGEENSPDANTPTTARSKPKTRPNAVMAETAYQLYTTIEDLSVMLAELKLSDEQHAVLKAKFADHKAAMADWEKANGAAVAAAQKSLAEARAAKDRPAMRTAASRLTAAREGQVKLIFRQQHEALALLTPEQKLQWAGHQLASQMKARFALAVLNDEQSEKIRKISYDAAKGVLDAADVEAEIAHNDQLYETILQTVLTEPQRKDLTPAGRIRSRVAPK